MTEPVLPGAVLGVLGGGQLGRMFSIAARQMGYRVSVFAPEADSPAGQIAHEVVRAPYTDADALRRFADGVRAITFEFENVPAEVTEAIGERTLVRPSGSLLHTTQNRAREKAALASHGIPVAPHGTIRSSADLEQAAETSGFPAVLKTSSFGYDGRGQVRVEDMAGLRAAHAELGHTEAVLERLIPFRDELSVVGARGHDGELAIFEPVLNRHEDHILDVTLCPAPVPAHVREAAVELARDVLTRFDVVGVLCVELFWLDDDSLIVNELAPRPHNSGHVTLDAHVCSQFEQQVRALCGLPLGSVERVVPAGVMVNLLGDVWAQGEPAWHAALADPRVRLHLYGKSDARPKRKMGHLTCTGDDLATVERAALAAREALRG